MSHSNPDDPTIGAPPPSGTELTAWKQAGTRVRNLRLQLGWTLTKLEVVSGVNRTMLCKYERLERPVTVNSALCLGPALGTTAKFILFG